MSVCQAGRRNRTGRSNLASLVCKRRHFSPVNSRLVQPSPPWLTVRCVSTILVPCGINQMGKTVAAAEDI
ncbi:hypothetical protein BsWGS_22956 [Bradybaena similaris]